MNAPPSELRAESRSAAKRAALALALFFAFHGRADSVWLRGGEKLIGKIVSEEPAKVVFESQTLGKIEIARDRIERLERDATAPSPAATNQAAAPSAPSGAVTNVFYPWLTPESLAKTNEFDWIQLKSGEWLKGRIKSLQEEKLEFDSEELNYFTFDWKDIHALHSPRLNSVRVEKVKPVDGAVFVTTNEVQVITPTATNIYPRSELLAITPTGNRELDKWSGSVSAGLSFRSGNTREIDLNARAILQRRTPDNRLYLDYEVNYGKVSDEQTEQNQRFVGQFDYFLSRRLYLRLPDIEYYRDPLINVAHRITLGAGVGYDLVKTPRTEWNLTASPSWQRNWFDDGSTTSAGALVFATRFDTELTKRLNLIFEYRGQLTRKESGNNIHHAETKLEFEIHKHLKLDVSFEWDRIADPKTEPSSPNPTPDDYRLITSLGIDF